MCRLDLDESIENALHRNSPSVAPAGRFELRYPQKNALKQYNFFMKKLRTQNAMPTWSVSQTLQHT